MAAKKHGGKREGAGRPSTGIVRKAVASLDAETNALLARLEDAWRLGTSDTIKRAIREAAERLKR